MEELFDVLVPQQIGNYQFKNPLLMKQAFKRKSYSEENGGQNNEVLEFIGDKVLDIAVVRYLAKRYGNDVHAQEMFSVVFQPPKKPEEFRCSINEGDLSKLKQKMVEKKALARRIDELGLARFLIMGKGDIAKDISAEASVKEDLFEAIIGAVALDSNWDFDVLQEVVEVMLQPDSFINDGTETDYVGLIYEWEAAKVNGVPWFKYPDYGPSYRAYSYNPDVLCQKVHGNTNSLKYTCQMKLADDMVIFEAYGRSKNEARKAVCELAYNYLKENGELFSINDEIDNPNLDESINQLETLARRGYFSVPTYESEERHDENGNPVWTVRCRIAEVKRTFSVVDSSKKAAKKKAAFMMLEYVLKEGSDNYDKMGNEL